MILRPAALSAAILTVLALGLSTGSAFAQRGAYQGNLLVAWRVQSQSEGLRTRPPVQGGQVVIDSRQGVSGRVVIQSSTRQITQGLQGFQQVMVMNGGQARINVSQQTPFTTWNWIGSGSQGGLLQSPSAGLVADTVWVDSGSGLRVRPQWAGGSSLVQVELEAESALPRGPGADPNLPPPQLSTSTSLSVPLGQWVTIARTQQQMDSSQGGGRFSTTRQRDDSAVLEIQVSLP